MRIISNIDEAASVHAPPAAASGPAATPCDDVRCGCGNLLARVVGDEVELKCRRCKQVWRLSLAGARGAPRWRLLQGGAR